MGFGACWAQPWTCSAQYNERKHLGHFIEMSSKAHLPIHWFSRLDSFSGVSTVWQNKGNNKTMWQRAGWAKGLGSKECQQAIRSVVSSHCTWVPSLQTYSIFAVGDSFLDKLNLWKGHIYVVVNSVSRSEGYKSHLQQAILLLHPLRKITSYLFIQLKEAAFVF